MEQQLEQQSTKVQQLKQRSAEQMQQLRGQVAELQGQLGQKQPITMDQVRKLVKDKLRKDERQKNLPKPRQPHSN